MRRMLSRRLSRPCAWTLGRHITRRLGGRAPNHIARALAALRRAARAHCQLIKLDPEQFDHGVRARREREREEEARRDAEWSATIAKVYGVSEREAAQKMNQCRLNSRGRNGAESVQKAQAVERRMCEWELWLALGREAFDRHRRLTPHRRLSLSTVARLMDTASVLGRLSTGLGPDHAL